MSRGWWAQTITVDFEQHIGRRIPCQTNIGRYEVSVSRVVMGEPATVRDVWAVPAATRKQLAGAKLLGPPTTSGTAKRLYWRCKLDGGCNVPVSFEPKKKERTLISIVHQSTEPLDADRLKTRWAKMIEALRDAA
jgi:hypothetical protein